MSERKMPDSYVETVLVELTSQGTTLYSKDNETPAIIHHRDPHHISSWESNPSISLGELEEIIAELAQAGADRVQIFHQEDHGEYHFVGTKLDMELSPEDEMKLKLQILNVEREQEVNYLNQCKANIEVWEKRLQKSWQSIIEAEKELEKIVAQKVGKMTRAEFEVYLKENGL